MESGGTDTRRGIIAADFAAAAASGLRGSLARKLASQHYFYSVIAGGNIDFEFSSRRYAHGFRD
jgi:hypothetical protein